MPRITKIYTRKGDDGTTSLGSNRRVSKSARRVRAYGDVDELNSVIGLALALGLDGKIAAVLNEVQHVLFNLGSELAFPEEERGEIELPMIEPKHVATLEKQIDEMLKIVGPLQNFILPGGTAGAAQLQVARAVCRRAERSVVTLSMEEKVSENALVYLNRLSDTLFTMARFENHQQGTSETLWNSLT